MKKYAIDQSGHRVRVGPIAKHELSDAYGCLRSYFYQFIVHKNDGLMKDLVAMGYKRSNKVLSRRQARCIARYYDLFIEGIYDDSIDESLIVNPSTSM